MYTLLTYLFLIGLFFYRGEFLSIDCGQACVIYEQNRQQFVKEDEKTHFDSDIVLNNNEIEVELFLENLRIEEIEYMNNHRRFIFTENFRDIKNEIDNDYLSFKYIQKMPKGGILHCHGIGDVWELIKLGTYDPDCWINQGSGLSRVPQYSFIYSNTTPSNSAGLVWERVVDLRAKASNPFEFDMYLLSLTQFVTPGEDVDETQMWVDFNTRIYRVESLAAKESVWERWVLSALRNLTEDGIIHMELRGFFNTITVPNTLLPKYNHSQIIMKWLKLIEELNSSNPPQLQMSIRFIYSVSRTISIDSIYADLLDALTLMADPIVGSYVVGFDIVNEEDRYYSLDYYLPAWLTIKSYIQQHNLTQIKYFFHAGETAWNKGIAENLYDAVLLNTTRIGHGFAIPHYPLVIAATIQKKILIEVNPISNQMLRLLDDMRDHPAVVMMNSGIQISINNDDPCVYGNQGLSYDMWASFISWNLTLTSLKKLTFNSISYSALSDQARVSKVAQLNGLWNSWINSMTPLIKQYSLDKNVNTQPKNKN